VLGIVPNAAVIIDDGQIGWLGPALAALAVDTSVDVHGRAVLPGWVNTHTQVVFARDRVDQSTARRSGDAQLDRAPSTVDDTRAATDAALLAVARWHRTEMLTGGTTCAATATGYRLTLKDEARTAASARTAGFEELTYFAATTMPADYTDDPDA
jgi:imidazolonepropionase